MARADIPLAIMEKIVKDVNPKIRVSDAAKSAMSDFIEEVSKQIARKSISYAEHAGRVTLKDVDVKKVREEMSRVLFI
ncbi:MAG: NFYB/HAP3 family transcription factor subunit [Candidatus Woesearchaeota archaeon]|nr:NFYB/HAP3 family transcription factor subunit [Candidatus Woesearchaeota archaeon]